MGSGNGAAGCYGATALVGPRLARRIGTVREAAHHCAEVVADAGVGRVRAAGRLGRLHQRT